MSKLIREKIERGDDLMFDNFIHTESLNAWYNIKIKDGVCYLSSANINPMFGPIVLTEGEDITISLIHQ